MPKNTQEKTPSNAVEKRRNSNEFKEKSAQQIEEMSKMLDRMKRDQAEFKNKVREMFKQNGIVPEEIEEKITLREKSSPDEFQLIQKKRMELLETMNLSADLKEKMRERFGLKKDSSLSKKQQANKSSRIRNIGSAPRRGWLPMR